MRIILGSQSPRRKKILKEIGLDFEIMSADINERAIREDKPEKLVLAIARAKAEALKARLFEPAILITADTVVVWKGKIIEKPEDKTEAIKFLERYNIDPVAEAITGIVAINLATNKQAEEVDRVKIHFNHFSKEDIDKLIKEGGVLDLAGGFEVDGELWERYIKKIDGPKDSAMGLPREITIGLIEEVGGKI